MDTFGEREYREVDADAMHRIIQPLEDELEVRFKAREPRLNNDQIDDLVAEAVAEIIFETLDDFPEFSKIVDRLEVRLGKLRVSMTE